MVSGLTRCDPRQISVNGKGVVELLSCAVIKPVCHKPEGKACETAEFRDLTGLFPWRAKLNGILEPGEFRHNLNV
jgi:hypothetical protein